MKKSGVIHRSLSVLLAALLIIPAGAQADTPPARTIKAELHDGVVSPNPITSTLNGAKRGIDTYLVNPNSAPIPAQIGNGTNQVAVKAPSTAPSALDPSLVVSISPNSSISVTANPPSNTYVPGSITTACPSGSGCAATSYIQITTDGFTTVGYETHGTWVGTLTTDVSFDMDCDTSPSSVLWYNTASFDTDGNRATYITNWTELADDDPWMLSTSGTGCARLRAVSLSSGTVDGTLVASVGTAAVFSVSTGNAASGATDSGNPIKIGGRYNTALPTLTNGQRGDAQLDVNGRLLTNSASKTQDGAGTAITSSLISGKQALDVNAVGVSVTQLADVEETGTISALNDFVEIDINGISAGRVAVYGTWVGTINFQGTVDGINWVPVGAYVQGASIAGTGLTSNAHVGLAGIAGHDKIRAIATAWTSGSANITINVSNGQSNTIVASIVPDSFKAQVFGSDTTFPIATQAGTGKLEIDAITGAITLPTGASTAAHQVTGNGLLTTIDASLTDINTDFDVALSTRASAAHQVTQNGSLASIDASTASIDTATASIDSSIDVALSTRASAANQATEITSLQFLDDVPSSDGDPFDKGVPIMGQLDEATIVDAQEDLVSPVRITTKRALHINLRTDAGVELGTSGAPIRTDPTGTTPQPTTQSGNWSTRLQDGSGNLVTSQASGAQRALDVGINVAGVQVDPRTRTWNLSASDVPLVSQGTAASNANGWTVKPGDGTDAQDYTATGEAKVLVTPLTNTSVVKAQLQDNAGTAIVLGQTTMSASVPVVIASNQTNLPTNLTQIGGATPSATNPIPVRQTDGTNFAGTYTNVTGAQGTNASPGQLPGAFVVQAAWDGTTHREVTADTSGNAKVVGGIAAGATDSGNPVKTGGVYNTTIPAYTNGQRGDTQIDARGSTVVTVVDGYKTTYSASIAGNVAVATATDVFTITGSASKTVRVNTIALTCTSTTGAFYEVQLLKRSTANTGGTSTTPTIVPVDSANAAGTAVVRAYTANPTVGTLVGNLRNARVAFPTSALQVGGGNTPPSPFNEFKWNSGDNHGQAITLRGTSEVLAFNFASVTTAGTCDFWAEWTEE